MKDRKREAGRGKSSLRVCSTRPSSLVTLLVLGGRVRLTLWFALSFAAACGSRSSSHGPATPISAAAIVRHVKILASDSFGGRAPSSRGEQKTVAYLRDEFTSIGLEPGNGKSFFQDVPLVEINGRPA